MIMTTHGEQANYLNYPLVKESILGNARINEWKWSLDETGKLGPGNITAASAWTGNNIDYFRLCLGHESGVPTSLQVPLISCPQPRMALFMHRACEGAAKDL